MRLATVRTARGDTRAAVHRGDVWELLDATDVGALLNSPDMAEILARPTGAQPIDDVVFAPVVPTPRKILCCGHNYREHIAEMGRDTPTHPTLFAKFADTLVGATDDIVLPDSVTKLDWEAELAVVVGTTIRNADRVEAGAAIAGYTVANDISARDWQSRTPQWLQGKAFDATTPLGPVLVTPDEFDPAAGAKITCSVNGVVHQNGSTDDLVFDTADLLAYISEFTVLRPGDVVLTGTPSGVGAAAAPPHFLKVGDIIETVVDGIGTLRNTISGNIIGKDAS
ncbi:fumarylacetoacetate hydrolase family protein [Rhodococcus sp. IEGM 1381]|uniref:fumarylacetoacetate hydrolase family protein n=1 Tax=Rhodococcus sp. IEGM 1381 TaxID=3047085 RepID=UPI0024B66B81|nr:fumarylacetoacetate hydrolase family protein [Rhodococcus sp. IEGM 1381]MDI9896888.1 fumarylacetoacetate hydrolase family protein [Rhodococcus sp. IEGM 1381]